MIQRFQLQILLISPPPPPLTAELCSSPGFLQLTSSWILPDCHQCYWTVFTPVTTPPLLNKKCISSIQFESLLRPLQAPRHMELIKSPFWQRHYRHSCPTRDRTTPRHFAPPFGVLWTDHCNVVGPEGCGERASCAKECWGHGFGFSVFSSYFVPNLILLVLQA